MNLDAEIRDALRASVQRADAASGYRAVQARLRRARRRRRMQWALAAAVVAVVAVLGGFQVYEQLRPEPVLVITDDPSVNEDGPVGSSPPATADDSGWQALTVTVGEAPVNSLAVDPSDSPVLYAATDQGLFRSGDGAGSWVQLFSEVTQVVTVDPASPSTVYACAEARADGASEAGSEAEAEMMALLRSDDRGASWQVLDDSVLGVDTLPAVQEGTAHFLFDTSTSPSTVYYYAWGLRMSTDRGESWTTLIPDDIPVDAVALDLTAPGTLYAVSGAFASVSDPEAGLDPPRFMRSTDGGATWEDLASRIPGLPLGRVAVDPADPSKLYQFIALESSGAYAYAQSTDQAESWTVLSGAAAERACVVLDAGPGTSAAELDALSAPMSGLTANGGKPPSEPYPWGSHVIAATTDDPPALYAFGESGVYKSTDAGTTWDQNHLGLGHATLQDVVVDPSSPDTVYVSTKAGIGKSTNGGATWFAVHEDTGSRLMVAPSAPSVLYALTSEGLFRSDDGGMSWGRRAFGGLPDLDGTPLTVLYELAMVAPDSPDTLYAVDVRGKAERSLYRSTDGGDTWEPGRTGGATVLGSLAYAPSDPSIVYAAGTVSPTPPGYVNYEAGDSPGVLRSDDGGASWTYSAAPGGVLGIAVDAEASSTVYVLCGDLNPWSGQIEGGTLYRSTDAGSTWQTVGFEHRGDIAWIVADPRVPGALYAACTVDGRTEVRLYRSPDEGATWEDMSGEWELDPVTLPSMWVEWRFAADFAGPAPGITLYAVAEGGLPVYNLYSWAPGD